MYFPSLFRLWYFLKNDHMRVFFHEEKLVLVGNGMAGIRTLENILKTDNERFDMTVFGTEPYPNYNRILLSKVLQGDTKTEDITLNDWNWYKGTSYSAVYK